MKNTPLYEIHVAAGGRLRPPDEPAPLLTYGDVPGEYLAALERCALFDETDRGLIRASGADAGDFLHGLLSNEVRSVAPGLGNRTLLLTARGKVRFDLDFARTAETFELSTPPGAAPALLEALDTYLFAEVVELVDATEEHAPLCVTGPAAENVVAALCGVPAPTGDRAHSLLGWGEHSLRVTALTAFGSPAWRLDAGAGGAVALWKALVEAGARPAGRVVADSLRVEACAALAGEDIDEGVYPQEARLESAFRLDKGCYVGQEVVAKIDTYGGLNKRLTLLAIPHDDPVPRGTSLLRRNPENEEWREVGVVTSWAWSFAADSGLALAYVKRRHQAVGTRLRLGDSSAEATITAAPLREGAVAVSGEFE
ncbi:MAG: hypothetical protein CMJ84_17865 [Planctomycetes bacterium]|nr:hypothetical protein [Planctomycetota bacterium]MDP6410764.1 glycine cleavage T C-terminal barrel domain-containing protein [Planctomycetota bacterium]